MASNHAPEQQQLIQAGQKRKREDSDVDIKLEGDLGEGATEVDVSPWIPDDYQPADENDGEQHNADDDDNILEEGALDQPTYDEDDEPFPACAVYDDDMDDLQEKVIDIPDRIVDRLHDNGCNSQSLESHLNKAANLQDLPKPDRMRIAILGGAGAGKSSLLNAVTGQPDLAKSLSGGQSCTCVPTEYRNEFSKQKLGFGAMIKYLSPDEIRRQLQETLKDYNTYAFKQDDEWDEDTRTTAKKAHENAFRVLLTLFNDLPSFQGKARTKAYMKKVWDDHHDDNVGVVDELVENCELKLKHTISNDYREWHEAETLPTLRRLIDPIMTSNGLFEKPALWPLVRQVFIGVRDSRILEKVTLVDLPGISDTNQARVELTHEYIKGCDYVWVVAPISRVVDDSTVYQLLSRYGKAFKGMICVVCTHSDEGIIGSEQKLANHLKQEDRDTKTYFTLTDQIKAKRAEMKELMAKITTVKKRKKSATKQQMLDVRAQEETVREMEGQCGRWEAERFEFFVQSRSSLVAEQLRESMENHLPSDRPLQVYCVSNYHYAALKGARITGPRLTADATGIPKLRADTLALMAPRLLATLEHHVYFSLKSSLHDFQLWMSNTTTDRRPDILSMTHKPQEGLAPAIEARIGDFAADIDSSANEVLKAAFSEASTKALAHLDNKRKKHPSTIMAFIRKDGNYATKLCPKESWNENFTKYFAEVVTKSEATLAKARKELTTQLSDDIVAALSHLKDEIQNFPADLPRTQLVDSIDTYIGGVRHLFKQDEDIYKKEIRNILLDVSQDSEKNPFTKMMRPIYGEASRDGGQGVTKRSLDRIEALLSRAGDRSPFAKVSESVTKKFTSTDKKHMESVQRDVRRLLQRLYKSVDELLEERVVDEAEIAVKTELHDMMPALLLEYDEVCRDLRAIKARYSAKQKTIQLE